MDSQRWEDIQRVFRDALELAQHQRQEYLAKVCADDVELLEEVQRMLTADAEGSGMLTHPVEYRAERLQPGSRLGNFELERVLGQGGMGRVFAAREIGLDRHVALKAMLPSLATKESDVERFHREARAVAKLDHPSIVPVWFVGQEHGIHFFTMRLVDGPNLNEVLCARREEREHDCKWLPTYESNAYIPCVAKAVSELADALQYAHSQGVVHRDVKPSNLMLHPAGGLALVDFGIMRDENLGAITQTGAVNGSPYYMSPEQAAASAARVDHRTDVYSLGVVLYELLTMARPFEGKTTLEVLNRLKTRVPRPVSERNSRVPKDLEVICAQAMAHHVADRYESAGALAGDLRRFLGSRPIHARPIAWRRRVQLWAKRHPLAVATVTAVLFAWLGGALWMRSSVRKDRIHDLLSRLQPFGSVEAFHSAPPGEIVNANSALDELEEWNESLSTEEARTVERSKQVRVQLLGDEEESLNQALLQKTGVAIRVSALDVEGRSLDSTLVRVRPFLKASSIPDKGPKEVALAAGESLLRLPGVYRIEVRNRDGKLLEFDRHLLEAGSECQLVADFGRWQDPGPDMVRIDPQPVTYPVEVGGVTPLHGVRLELEPYLLDRYEVSNREYLAFVREYPERRSHFWNAASYDKAWAELPVVGVSVEDAVAYAEWKGLRLPSDAELEYAGRGPLGRRYPWTDEPKPGELLGNVQRPAVPEGIGANDLFAIYLAGVVPVQSSPESASEFEVYHLFGNVSELTSSLANKPDGQGGWLRMEDTVAVLGSYWRAAWLDQTLATSHTFQHFGDAHASYFRGFRCARSAPR